MFEGTKTPEERFSRAFSLYEETCNKLETNGYITRMYRNYDMASGIDGKQYTQKIKRQLEASGLPSNTINITKKIVNVKTGLMLENPVSTSYSPRGQQVANDTNILQDMFDYNKDRGNWEEEIAFTIRDSNVMVGYMKAFWDFSNDRDFGDMGFKNINPKYILPDPNWTTNRFKDSQRIIEYSWMSPKDIKDSFNVSTEEIRNAIESSDPSSNSATDGVGLTDENTRYTRHLNHASGEYRIVEIHYMERQKVEKLVDRNTKKDLRIAEIGEDEALRMVTTEGERYYLDEDTVDVNKVFIFAPDLMNKVLYDGDYQLQLGRLPYTMMAYDLTNGEVQGVVDQVSDLNQIINKRESGVTNVITKTSNNNYTVEESAFNEPSDFKDFQNNVSKGGRVFKVSDGTNSEGKIKLVERGQAPTDLMRATDRAYEQLNDLVNMTPTQQGQSSGSHQSGVLYKAMLKQSMSSDSMMNLLFKSMYRDMAEMFYYAFPQVYRDAQRKFYLPDGRAITLNEYGVNGVTGEVTVKNDVLNLPRYDFTIDMSKLGATKRQEQVANITETLKITTNPIRKAILESELDAYADFTPETKAKLQKGSDVWIEFLMKQHSSQTAQLDLAEVNADKQKEQLENPPQQPNPMAFAPQGGQEPPQDPTQIAKGPGMGEMPGASGFAGTQTGANNVGSAPSDMTNR